MQLHTFSKGDIAEYDTLFAKYEKAQPILVENKVFLKQKIRILALMRAVFIRSSSERTLSFAEVAKYCDMETTDVELLVRVMQCESFNAT
jgi:26S proteasome regulatory subunit N9